MRLAHQSIEKYLKKNEELFLGKTFYSPVLLSKDTLLFFSTEKNRQFICFDLSTKNPCFYVGKTSQFFESINSVFAAQLRAISNEFMVVDYDFSKNDYVLKLRVAVSNNAEEDLFFIFEIFPNHPNLIITKLTNEVICAFYHAKDGRPEAGSKYVEPSNEILLDGDTILDEKLIENLFAESIQKRRLDKYENFIKNLESKIKKCSTKMKNILNDKIHAETQLNYQQIADNLLVSGIDLKQRIPSIEINGEVIELDASKTISENIQIFYKKVKKGKATINLVNENLDRAENEIKLYQSILDQLYAAESEKEADKIVSAYSFNKKREVSETAFNKPWKINYQGVYIYFGKNSSQNDYLSFVMKQDRQFTWMHIKDRSGAHIVVASLKPTEDQLLFAAELALHQSKVKAGEVEYTRKKNIRRGHVLGEAIVKNYSVIKINNIRERSLELFETAKRCD